MLQDMVAVYEKFLSNTSVQSSKKIKYLTIMRRNFVNDLLNNMIKVQFECKAPISYS